MSYYLFEDESDCSKRAAAILFTDGKSMLLLKRAGEGDHIGTWALPGGKAKEGETEIANAVRETKEETGLSSIPGRRFGSLSTEDGEKKFTVFLYKIDKPFDVSISKEHSGSQWVDFDNLKDIRLHPKFKKALPKYLDRIQRSTATFTEWCYVEKAIRSL